MHASFFIIKKFSFIIAMSIEKKSISTCYATFTLIYILIDYILLVNKVKYKWPHLYIKRYMHKRHRLLKCEWNINCHFAVEKRVVF